MSTQRETQPTVSKYSAISTNVWVLFKKYLLTDADFNTFADDVGLLNDLYEGTPEYKFMQSLLKVYCDELNRIKG